MVDVDLKGLVRKLNGFSKKGLENAAGLCVSRSHYEVRVEHFLAMLLDDPEADGQKILHHAGVSPSRPLAALQQQLEAMKGGNSGRPVFSPLLSELIQDAWLLASVEYADTHVRSGHVFLAILQKSGRYLESDLEDLLKPIPREEVKRDLYRIAGRSKEAEAPEDTAGGGRAPDGRPAEETAIGRFMIDVTDRAKKDEIDPVFGRDREIRMMIDILARRRKNNPIVVGEPGVGKTAVVEGLALRIASGDVPDVLRNVRLLSLDLGLLQAGAGVRGEFENRLKEVIKEVKASAQPVITFIDEAHTLIGAGGQAGQADAANLLKPALARGELRTIAATTWSEYKKYFEKDPALERRFQLVKLDEPSVDDAVLMMRGLRDKYEAAHGVRITEEAVEAAAKLSARYISGRQLPDKAVDLLDTAAARVRVAQATLPVAVDDIDRRLQEIDRESAALEREAAMGEAANPERLAELAAEKTALDEERAALVTRWESEKAMVAGIMDLRKKLHGDDDATDGTGADGAASADGEAADATDGTEGANGAAVPLTPAEEEALRAEIQTSVTKLRDAQGDLPLVPLDVDGRLVGEVVASWTGIPVGKMLKDSAAAVLSFRDAMAARIKGQDEALDAIDRGVRAARANLHNPLTPQGIFLLVGPSGVGKTESATAVADLMYGGDRFMTTINMSEFQGKETVSRLIGSAPGLVGYGEGGVLTEAVRQRPHSVILLDEAEKADPEVLNVFYQVFDKGMLADGEGRVIDFKNTMVFLTSNLASAEITQMAQGPVRPSTEELTAAIRPILSAHFKPALLARMTIVPFFPLVGDPLKEIVRLKLGKVQKRLEQSHRMALALDPKVEELIAARCTEVEAGARNIDHIVNQGLLPVLSTRILEQLAAGPLPDAARVEITDTEEFSVTFDTGSAS